MRQADEKFYITLALRNFNRGPPLLPSDEHDEPMAVQESEWDPGRVKAKKYVYIYIYKLNKF